MLLLHDWSEGNYEAILEQDFTEKTTADTITRAIADQLSKGASRDSWPYKAKDFASAHGTLAEVIQAWLRKSMAERQIGRIAD